MRHRQQGRTLTHQPLRALLRHVESRLRPADARRSDRSHLERVLGTVPLGDRAVEVVFTRHADWRMLTVPRSALLHCLALLARALEETGIWSAVAALPVRPGDWRTAVDESVALMDLWTDHSYVCGLHPWLSNGAGRITVLTIIPRTERIWFTRIRGVFYLAPPGKAPRFRPGDLPPGTPVVKLPEQADPAAAD